MFPIGPLTSIVCTNYLKFIRKKYVFQTEKEKEKIKETKKNRKLVL